MLKAGNNGKNPPLETLKQVKIGDSLTNYLQPSSSFKD
jgi:hypothetical protein